MLSLYCGHGAMAGDVLELHCVALTAAPQQTSSPWLLGQVLAPGDRPAQGAGSWLGVLQLARAYNMGPRLGRDVGGKGPSR